MSEDSTRRGSSQRERGGDSRPGPRPGWRITPPPGGRSNNRQPGAPPPRRNQRWIIAALIVGALALNLWISSQVLKPNPRVRVPYSPTFLAQVKAGNVSEISSTGDSIQGSF